MKSPLAPPSSKPWYLLDYPSYLADITQRDGGGGQPKKSFEDLLVACKKREKGREEGTGSPRDVSLASPSF